MEKKKVLLAFSGGLDTTFCAVYLAREKKMEVHSAIVNTGGFQEEDLEQIATHAGNLRTASHQVLDVTADYYNTLYTLYDIWECSQKQKLSSFGKF